MSVRNNAAAAEPAAKVGVKGSFLMKLALTNASSCVSETATFPIDFTKTVMQSTKGKAGIFSTARTILQTSGVGGFYQVGLNNQSRSLLSIITCLALPGLCYQIFTLVFIPSFFPVLSQGLPPAILRHWVYTGARINLYEAMRDTYKNEDDSAAQMPVIAKFGAGAAAGGIAQMIASPTDLVKVRM
jgi:solute carrier family 25 uncoupling protein 27